MRGHNDSRVYPERDGRLEWVYPHNVPIKRGLERTHTDEAWEPGLRLEVHWPEDTICQQLEVRSWEVMRGEVREFWVRGGGHGLDIRTGKGFDLSPRGAAVFARTNAPFARALDLACTAQLRLEELYQVRPARGAAGNIAMELQAAGLAMPRYLATRMVRTRFPENSEAY